MIGYIYKETIWNTDIFIYIISNQVHVMFNTKLRDYNSKHETL